MPDNSNKRAERIREIFNLLVELPHKERVDKLDELCLNNPSLLKDRQEIELLLKHDQTWQNSESEISDPRIGEVIGNYEILSRIGEGGMGVVYKSFDMRLRRTVAIKFLPQRLSSDHEANERFVREAQTASALDHANICTIYEIGETRNEELFIAMAYYEGETLRQKVERGPLPIDEALRYAMQIGQGLSRAHEAGIIHRDLKSANVMITERGEVKLLDFGLAKLAGSVDLTKTGTMMGTPTYMSPEQAQGLPVDHRTDIWSFGVVLYEMLTGKCPFSGDYIPAVLYAIVNKGPVSLTVMRPEISRPLAEVVSKALVKDPNSRYQHIDQLLLDMHASWQTHEASSARLWLSPEAQGSWKGSDVVTQNTISVQFTHESFPILLAISIFPSIVTLTIFFSSVLNLELIPVNFDFCSYFCERKENCISLLENGAPVRLPAQPINSLTSLAYLITASLAFRVRRDSSAYWFATVCVLLGIGSSVFHSFLTTTSFRWDLAGTYAVMTFLAIYGCYAIFKWQHPGVAFLVSTSICVFLSLFVLSFQNQFLNPVSAVIIILLLIYATITLKITWQQMFLTVAPSAIAFVFLKLDVNRVLCDPDSFYQGHAVWHMFSAWGIYKIYDTFNLIGLIDSSGLTQAPS